MDELIASLMLPGLPDHYKPMIMAVSNSCVNISTDLIKNKVIEESSKAPSEDFSENLCYILIFTKKTHRGKIIITTCAVEQS